MAQSARRVIAWPATAKQLICIDFLNLPMPQLVLIVAKTTTPVFRADAALITRLTQTFINVTEKASA